MPAKTFVPTLAVGAFVSLAAMVAWRRRPTRRRAPHAMMAGGTITKAIAVLQPTKDGGEVSGTVTFTQTGHGIQVVADIHGLTPGKHGFHIHEFGDPRSPDAMSAGGHFNPRMHRPRRPDDDAAARRRPRQHRGRRAGSRQARHRRPALSFSRPDLDPRPGRRSSTTRKTTSRASPSATPGAASPSASSASPTRARPPRPRSRPRPQPRRPAPPRSINRIAIPNRRACSHALRHHIPEARRSGPSLPTRRPPDRRSPALVQGVAVGPSSPDPDPATTEGLSANPGLDPGTFGRRTGGVRRTPHRTELAITHRLMFGDGWRIISGGMQRHFSHSAGCDPESFSGNELGLGSREANVSRRWGRLLS